MTGVEGQALGVSSAQATFATGGGVATEGQAPEACSSQTHQLQWGCAAVQHLARQSSGSRCCCIGCPALLWSVHESSYSPKPDFPLHHPCPPSMCTHRPTPSWRPLATPRHCATTTARALASSSRCVVLPACTCWGQTCNLSLRVRVRQGLASALSHLMMHAHCTAEGAAQASHKQN